MYCYYELSVHSFIHPTHLEGQKSKEEEKKERRQVTSAFTDLIWFANSMNDISAVRSLCRLACANSSDANKICDNRTAVKCCRPAPVLMIVRESTVVPRRVGHAVVVDVESDDDGVEDVFVFVSGVALRRCFETTACTL